MDLAVDAVFGHVRGEFQAVDVLLLLQLGGGELGLLQIQVTLRLVIRELLRLHRGSVGIRLRLWDQLLFSQARVLGVLDPCQGQIGILECELCLGLLDRGLVLGLEDHQLLLGLLVLCGGVLPLQRAISLRVLQLLLRVPECGVAFLELAHQHVILELEDGVALLDARAVLDGPDHGAKSVHSDRPALLRLQGAHRDQAHLEVARADQGGGDEDLIGLLGQ